MNYYVGKSRYGFKQSWQTKAVGFGAMGVILVGFGWALVYGTIRDMAREEQNIIETVVIEEQPDEPPPPPPPPPPEFDAPPPPMVPIPLIQFDRPPTPTTIQVPAGEPVVNTAPPPPVVAPPAPVGPTRGPQRQTRRNDEPDYPEASIRLEEFGDVTVRVCADIEGEVTSLEIVESSGSTRLDRSAEQWLRRGRYDPALENGVPVAGCANTIVGFELPE